MTFSEYQQQIQKYLPDDEALQSYRAGLCDNITHFILGLVTETAELADILKKHVAQGKSINKEHVTAEIGDLLWYLGNLMSETGITLEQCLEHNLKKLEIRYSDGYSHEAALAKKDKAQGGF